MKKIFVITTFLSLLFLSGSLIAQKKQSKKRTDETEKVEKKKDVSDAKKKSAADRTVHKSTGINKNGTPDMRLKVNKEAKEREASSAKTYPTSPRGQSPTASTSSSTGDRVIGTDEKGRTIYEGKRGGHYYINKNGNKEYIKKS